MSHEISVIIPVYNCSKTIRKCVDSLLLQSFDDIEILLINDGSTDDSLNVIKELAKEDERIKIFTKPNGGQSSARNLGLDNATGDYISFIDGDDYVEHDMLTMLYRNIVEENAQMSICGVKIINNGQAIINNYPLNKIVFNTNEALTQLLAEKYILFSVCDKLYKRSLFANLRFEEGVIHEDVLLPYQITKLCDKIVCEMKPKYNYVLNDSSTTGKPFSKARLNDIYAREQIVKDIEQNYPELIKNSMNVKLTGYLNIINKLLSEKASNSKEFLNPLVKKVRHDSHLYLINPFINRNKKLGVILLSMGKLFYKLAYAVFLKSKAL